VLTTTGRNSLCHLVCSTVNYFGVIRCCKAFIPLLKKQAQAGTHKGGRIITMTSMAGLVPGEYGFSTYCASKHAAQSLTESLRFELANFGIQVMTVNPSFHNTSIIDTVQPLKLWETLPSEVKVEYGEGK
jgi:NAD(P)-dependent dehydrogenase (short-subunit alcohol dehydrogenase family)